MVGVRGRASDNSFPAADDPERHSAPLLLQEPAGLILVVLCPLDDPERHAAPLLPPEPAGQESLALGRLCCRLGSQDLDQPCLAWGPTAL